MLDRALDLYSNANALEDLMPMNRKSVTLQGNQEDSEVVIFRAFDHSLLPSTQPTPQANFRLH
jgi:hypothetical protein